MPDLAVLTHAEAEVRVVNVIVTNQGLYSHDWPGELICARRYTVRQGLEPRGMEALHSCHCDSSSVNYNTFQYLIQIVQRV